MLRRLLLAAVLLAGCAGSGDAGPDDPGSVTTVTTDVGTIGTTTVAEPTTTATEALEECGTIPYTVDALPGRVDADRPEPGQIPQDQYTTIPATRSDLWFDEEGELAVAFIRGSLPPEEWPGDRGEVSIDGARGVAGAFEDGSWVVAWFEGDGDDRCDRYFIVFYPPVEPSEVEATIESLDRTAG